MSPDHVYFAATKNDFGYLLIILYCNLKQKENVHLDKLLLCLQLRWMFILMHRLYSSNRNHSIYIKLSMYANEYDIIRV